MSSTSSLDYIATPGLYHCLVPGTSTDSLVLSTPLDIPRSDSSRLPEIAASIAEDDVFGIWRRFQELKLGKEGNFDRKRGQGVVIIECGMGGQARAVIELTTDQLRKDFASWGIRLKGDITSINNPSLNPQGVTTFFNLLGRSPLALESLATLSLPALDTALFMASVFGLMPLVEVIRYHHAGRVGLDAPISFKKAAKEGDIGTMTAAIASLGVQHPPAEALKRFWLPKDPYSRLMEQCVADLRDGREIRGEGTFWEAVAALFEVRAREYLLNLTREPIGRPHVKMGGHRCVAEEEGWMAKFGRSMRRLVKT